MVNCGVRQHNWFFVELMTIFLCDVRPTKVETDQFPILYYGKDNAPLDRELRANLHWKACNFFLGLL